MSLDCVLSCCLDYKVINYQDAYDYPWTSHPLSLSLSLSLSPFHHVYQPTKRFYQDMNRLLWKSWSFLFIFCLPGLPAWPWTFPTSLPQSDSESLMADQHGATWVICMVGSQNRCWWYLYLIRWWVNGKELEYYNSTALFTLSHLATKGSSSLIKLKAKDELSSAI